MSGKTENAFIYELINKLIFSNLSNEAATKIFSLETKISWRELVILPKFLSEKKHEFCIQRVNKKISKGAERQGKRLKATRKNHIDKNKEKEGALWESGAFYIVHGIS